MRTFNFVGNIIVACALLSGSYAHGAPQRSKPASETPVPGDAARGAMLFREKGGCAACHRVMGQGSRLGSNLSEIATKRTVEELQKALLDPPAQAQPQSRLYKVVTREGVVSTGKLLNQNQSSLQMLDAKERLVAFQKSNIREAGFVDTPAMPSYRDKLSAEEMQDLIAYLASLKGVARE